ncbi:hypothetical protein GcM3_091025, partial [Golovinomyces cichoracearum]
EEKAARRKVELDGANSTSDQVKRRAQQLEAELAIAKDKIKNLTKHSEADKSGIESKRVAASHVASHNLRMTYENLVSVLESEGDTNYTKESVIQSYRCLYHWTNRNILGPIYIATPDVPAIRLMWPHGSTKGGREEDDDPLAVPLDKILRRIQGSHLRSAARSVVSSEHGE